MNYNYFMFIYLVLNLTLLSQNSNSNFIDIYLDLYTITSSNSEQIQMYGISGLDQDKIMFNRSYNNKDALQDFNEREKCYEQVIRRIAFQNEFSLTNLMEVYNGNTSDESTFEILANINTAAQSTDLLVNYTELLSELKWLRYVKTVDGYTKHLNKLKTIGRNVRHGNLNNFSAALSAISSVLDLVDAVDNGIQIYNSAMLLDALQFDLGIERLKYLKFSKIIEDNAFKNALNSVLSDLENLPSNYWDQLAQSLKMNQKQIMQMILSFASAANNVASTINFTPLNGWIGAILFSVDTWNMIQNWENSLRQSSIAATIYMNLKNTKSFSSDYNTENLLEYTQYLFLDNMDIVLNNNYLKFWEFKNKGQKEVRVFINEEFNTLKKKIISRRFEEFKSTLKNESQNNVTLGFILDSSGSMAQNDPHDMRKSAVEMIINELNGNENIFLVDFDDKAVWLNPNNYKNYNKDLLKNDIRRINSDGGTQIESGLITIQNSIENNVPNISRGGIILLTDGKNNNAFNYSSIDWFKQNNFPISTVSFVGDVDNSLLSNIASITNGNYFRANSASDVVSYFREFINSISGNSSLTMFRNLIQQGETQTCSYFVDKGMSFIYAGNNWSGSKIRLKLTSPKGVIYTEKDNNGEWNIGSNYSSVKIFNPVEGKWQAEFFGESIPAGGEDYVFQVTGDSPNKINLEDQLLSTGKMQFSLKNSDKGNISNIKPKIEVITPTNKREDISANFSNDSFSYRPRDGQGNYNFEISLTGKDNSGSTIQRYFARTILVGETFPSNIAPVKMMEGNYIYTDLGKDIGNFQGIDCIIYSQNNNEPIATGYVINVSETECLIEIQNFTGEQNVRVGDTVVLDESQWQQD